MKNNKQKEQEFINILYWKCNKCGHKNHPIFTRCKKCLWSKIQKEK